MEKVFQCVGERILISASKVGKKAFITSNNGKTIITGEVFLNYTKAFITYLKDNDFKGIVPVILPRRWEYISAVTALNYLGIPYVPLLTKMPQKRIDFIKQEVESLFEINEDIIENVKNIIARDIPSEAKKEGTALLFYTSGSTGTPKGVIYSNSFFLKAIENDDTFKDYTDWNVGVTSSFSFTVSVINLYSPLVKGYSVHLINDETVSDVRLLERYIEKENINHIFLPPPLLRHMSNHLAALRRVISCGERLANIAPRSYQIYNVYGLTETCLATTFLLDKLYNNTPIGKPHRGVKVYLIDDNGELSIDSGEIAIASINADGYFKDEERTKRVFKDNPYDSCEEYKSLMFTGDLGKLVDGQLVYIGRKDKMVKINGQRVEPSEAEFAMSSFPNIKEAVVKAFENKNGQTYLTGYFVSDVKIDLNELRNHLKQTLNEYMIPTYLLQIKEFKKNTNGKIDRTLLKEVDASTYKADYIAPNSDNEKLVAKAFENVLRVDNIGVNDDFFSLGGDSILTIELLSFIGIDSLTSISILQKRTVKEIAKLLDENIDIDFLDSKERKLYPLNAGQMGVYLSYIANKEDLSYNIPFYYELDKSIDPIRLESSIKKVIKHFPIFYTSFKEIDGEIGMIKNSNPYINVEIRNILENEFNQFKEGFAKPFDLESGHLSRFNIVISELKTYLFIDIHHIIFDGSSLPVLLKAINKAYLNETLEEESIDIFKQNLFENQVDLNKQNAAESYFDNCLVGNEYDSSILEDEIIKPETLKGTTTSFSLSNSISTLEVEHFCNLNKISEATLFLSGFAYVLAKATGGEGFNLTTVNSGRHTIGLKNSIGMFVKTMPLSIKVDENIDNVEFFRSVQNMLNKAIEYDYYPFQSLVNKYGVNNDTMFVYQGEMFNSVYLGEATYQTNFIDTHYPLAKLTMNVYKNTDGYDISIAYRNDLYNKETIEMISTLYKIVIRAFVNNIKMSSIKLLSEEEEIKLDNSNIPNRIDETISFISMFKNCVNKFGNKDCVIYKDRRYTYKQVDEMSDTLACKMYGLGIRKGDVVAILSERNEFITILPLAVLKLGAIYQPLDSSYPSDRLTYMAKDSGAKLLLTPSSLRNLVEIDIKTINIDQFDFTKHDVVNVIKVNKDDGFALLYTSGSTGLPKGCLITSGNISTFIQYVHKEYEYDSNCNASSYASFGFDANMMETTVSLSIGASLFIIPLSMRLNLDEVNDYFNNNNITHSFMTTQVGRQFALIQNNNSLRYLFIGGESLTPLTPPKNYHLVNVYGPTEGTVWVTSFVIDRLYKNVPIGKSGSDIKMYVVDKYMRRVPTGVPGELLLAGPHVAKGYLNLIEKTNEVFINNPFDNTDRYTRTYKTGDIVRYLEDGNIQFIGRKDSQVKIRGFRIELSEVEEVIRRFPDIKDATITANTDETGTKFITAYIVSDKKIDIEDLNSFICDEKPSYMVPSITMQIDSIPLNQNQKVNRRLLPKPERKVENIILPRNDMEQQIYGVVSSLLGHSSFSVNEDLFNVGVSSISSIKLCSMLSKKFESHISVADLKENNTIEKLTRYFESLDKEDEQVLLDRYPLTKTQEGLFYECLNKGISTVYNIPSLIKLGNNVDISLLKESLVKVINAHPYILSNIKMTKEGVYIKRSKEEFASESIEVLKVDNITSIQKTLVIPFDLENSTLFRIKIILTKTNNFLFMDFHHLIFDGTSFEILLRDIDKAYEGQIVLKEEFDEYLYSYKESKERQTDRYKKAKEYYLETFSGLDGSSLPIADNPNIESGSGVVELKSKRFDLNRVKEYCKNNKITENVYFTTVFGYLLSKYSQEELSLFGTVYNGRNDPRVLSSLGMFVKTYPVLVDTRIVNPKELVKTVSKQMSNSQANDIYSFMEINRDIGISADVLFVYQGEGFLPKTFLGEQYEFIRLQLDSFKSVFSLEVSIVDQQILLSCNFDRSKYTEKFIKSFLEVYLLALENYLESSDINAINLLNTSIIKKLDSFNKNHPIYPDLTITELINKACKKYPNKVAVVYENESITYKQLDDYSSKIAQKLISLGAEPEDKVAILSDRDVYMAICPVGVLKARCIYQPLDSSYPKERLTFMVKDSQAKILITPRHLRDLIDIDIETIYVEDIPSLEELSIDLPVSKPHDGFSLLYTSGSTGLPKGCILEHHCVAASLLSYIDYTHADEKDRFTSFASFGFDANMLETFSPLIIGATLYILSNNLRMELNKLADYYNENKITYGVMTTQVGREFASSFKLDTLKHFIVGGEALTPFNPPNFKFYNGYGPTECAIFVTLYDVDKMYRNVPIGKAIGDVDLYVVDKHMNRLPVGMVGELCASGPQVARGYLNREEKTKEVFVENPFSDDPRYKTMYKTGDIVRYLDDGNIQFIGRKDSQVKIRGFRIELSEVEEVIRRFPGIKDATVVAFNEPNGGKYLAGYVVSDVKIDIEKLKNFIASEKPPYMVPASFMQIDKIPLNQNQKVNKKLLPKIEKTNDVVYEKPLNETEADFAIMMGEILGINPFSATSSFFDMGGSSISASRLLVMAISKGYSISYSDIFSFATPRLLADHCLKDVKSTGVSKDNETAEIYDYNQINEFLRKQTIENIDEAISKDRSIIKDRMGNILLPGCTGFLGIHVLKEFLLSYKGIAYCLVRGKDDSSAKKKLKSRLVYYFFDDFEEYFDNGRIQIINGTINDTDLFTKVKDVDFNTIINCAACVKHFVSDDSLYRTNTLGVRNLLSIVRKLNKRLIQTSTYSVSGYINDELIKPIYEETDLYIKQTIDNEYIRTKFLAERDCIEAAKEGYNVKITRLGNLMPRYSDGEFQINFITNGFMRDLRGATALGKIPLESLSKDVDLSPIDHSAECVLKISDSDLPMTVYHVYNNYKVRVIDVLQGLEEAGFDLKVISEKEYRAAVKEAMKKSNGDDETSDLLGGLVAYKDAKTGTEPVSTKVSNELTTKALYRLLFRWQIVDKHYVSKAIENLLALRFFNKDYKL